MSLMGTFSDLSVKSYGPLTNTNLKIWKFPKSIEAEQPNISETCSKQSLIFSSPKHNYILTSITKQRKLKKIQNWDFKLELKIAVFFININLMMMMTIWWSEATRLLEFNRSWPQGEPENLIVIWPNLCNQNCELPRQILLFIWSKIIFFRLVSASVGQKS